MKRSVKVPVLTPRDLLGHRRGGEGRSEAVSEGPGTDTKGSTGP